MSMMEWKAYLRNIGRGDKMKTPKQLAEKTCDVLFSNGRYPDYEQVCKSIIFGYKEGRIEGLQDAFDKFNDTWSTREIIDWFRDEIKKAAE